MNDPDEPDRDRMRRDEDTYLATQKPPRSIGEILADEPMYTRRALWERRRDVIRLLEEHPEYSDRRLARIAAVSRELVSQIRRNLIRTSTIASRHALARVGADGKTYKRLPRPRKPEGAKP